VGEVAGKAANAIPEATTGEPDITGVGMLQVRDFIATLHVIAASDGLEERLRLAVREAFARFVREAQAPLWGRDATRTAVVGLQDALTEATLRPGSKRFEILRSCAHDLAIEWLREN